MTTTQHDSGGREAQDPELWPPISEPEPDYRQLEHAYRHSDQYAAMVQRYPLLERSIAACRQPDLVGDHRNDDPATPPPRHRGSGLRWERSHGES